MQKSFMRASLMMQVGAMLQVQAGHRVRNFETKVPEKQMRSQETRLALISAAQQKRILKNEKRRANDVRSRVNSPVHHQ